MVQTIAVRRMEIVLQPIRGDRTTLFTDGPAHRCGHLSTWFAARQTSSPSGCLLDIPYSRLEQRTNICFFQKTAHLFYANLQT